MKKTLLIFGCLALLSCVPRRPILNTDFSPASEPSSTPQSISQPDPQSDLPSEINLDVPFFTQAPDGNWSLPWQEACEEASVILAYHYASGIPLDLDLYKKELRDLFEWENRNFGDYKDTTIDQTAQMIREFWGFDRVRVVADPTVDQIKRQLAQGNPVVAPFSGRDIKNPFYSNRGPYYHMMVIKGYDSANFITNDVGTRKGANYRYPFVHLMSVMHDWDEEDVRWGTKKVIILEKKL
jgi:hypothetical protein